MFNLLLTLAIGYELQKLIQLNFFFRLRSLVADYYPNIQTKLKSTAFKELLVISFADLGYALILLIGLFTINLYFCASIFLLTTIQNIIFKIVKNKTIRKVTFTTVIILSIILLSLSVINSMYYHLDGIQLIKQIWQQLH